MDRSHSDRRGPTPRKEFGNRGKRAVTRLAGTDVFRMLNVPQPQEEAVASGSGQVNPHSAALFRPTYPLCAQRSLNHTMNQRNRPPDPPWKKPSMLRPPLPFPTFANLSPSSSAPMSILFARKMLVLRLLLVPPRSQNQSPQGFHLRPLLRFDRERRWKPARIYQLYAQVGIFTIPESVAPDDWSVAGVTGRD